MSATHYTHTYYDRFAGLDIGRQMQARVFEAHCRSDLDLLDFGCSDGLMLRHLPARRRVGVEINPAARAVCTGLDALHESLAAVPDNSIDLAVSNHALEHVPHPLATLTELYRVLRPGGTLALVTPFEDPSRAWIPDDPDRHLYTWAPVNLGNLLSEAGFRVDSVVMRWACWHPKMFWTRLIGLFDLASWLLGHALRRREVVAVAGKPKGVAK